MTDYYIEIVFQSNEEVINQEDICQFFESRNVRVVNKGDLIPPSGNRVKQLFYKDNRAFYRSPLMDGYDIDVLLDFVLKDVKDFAQLSSYCKHNNLNVLLYIVIRGKELPGITLSQSFIHFCYLLNAVIDIDIIL